MIRLTHISPYRSPTTPLCKHSGLGSSRFARRYSGNRCFFLFLQVLRCFSSLRLPHLRVTPYNRCWVAPFGNLWIKAYLPLPRAYRGSSRPSSAPSAKAFTVCPLFLNHIFALMLSHRSYFCCIATALHSRCHYIGLNRYNVSFITRIEMINHLFVRLFSFQ